MFVGLLHAVVPTAELSAPLVGELGPITEARLLDGIVLRAIPRARLMRIPRRNRIEILNQAAIIVANTAFGRT